MPFLSAHITGQPEGIKRVGFTFGSGKSDKLFKNIPDGSDIGIAVMGFVDLLADFFSVLQKASRIRPEFLHFICDMRGAGQNL